MKIVAFTVLAFCSQVSADDADDAMNRHESKPERYIAPQMIEVDSRSAGRSEAPRCIPDADGFFGDKSANGVTLEYYYQLEYNTHVLPAINDRVLKTIQNKIADYLLPVLFERTCSDTRRELADSLRRRLEAVGISALPDDVLVEGGRLFSMNLVYDSLSNFHDFTNSHILFL